jgi:hypothetical protein
MKREQGTVANPFRQPMVVIGIPSDTEIACGFDAGLTDSLIQEPHCFVLTGSDHRPLWATQTAAR